jgi:hypothetical protein
VKIYGLVVHSGNVTGDTIHECAFDKTPEAKNRVGVSRLLLEHAAPLVVACAGKTLVDMYAHVFRRRRGSRVRA